VLKHQAEGWLASSAQGALYIVNDDAAPCVVWRRAPG
jgi:hypothetical protein